MKLFKIVSTEVLMWVFPLLLLIPNITLCATERYSAAGCAANILLPIGVYLLLMSLSRNVGRSVLLCTPLSIYAAFQIVLLFLYGESIIAIDMFLNVATTNVGEATELLANLGPAITTVVLLYMPPIVWAVYLVLRHEKAARNASRNARRAGACCAGAGFLAVILAMTADKNYIPQRCLFPLNVIDNTFVAVDRFHTTKNYPNTSAGWSYHAHGTHADSVAETYVLVVGETCRADNWQLLGYDRPTNPRLSKRADSLVVFGRALSESNTTHKSVPLMLSPLTAETFGDSIYHVRSIFEAFREAGYSTAFFSNQQHNGSFIDFFGEQADECVFIADCKETTRRDSALVPMLRDFLKHSKSMKNFVVLHSYGSHFDYRSRYSDEHRVFTPDDNDEASINNRRQLINAYDNTIVSTDAFIDDVISVLDSLDISAAMLFVPDHGEDIFDDDRQRFLHASPAPTYWQIHVPVVLWTSPEYNIVFPDKIAAARANRDKNISSSRAVFDTMLSLSGLRTDHFRPRRALTENHYQMEPRMYLNDYNEGVRLEHSGLNSEDFLMLECKRISASGQ